MLSTNPPLPACIPWRVEPADLASAEVQQLLAELSQVLLGLTGDAGTSSFNADDLNQPRAALLVARDATGLAGACGVLRPLEGDGSHRCGEIKRMYARSGSQGAGSAVLLALERQASAWGYERLQLATRRVNARAVAFYLARGYAECAPYGRYVGRETSICLSKALTALVG